MNETKQETLTFTVQSHASDNDVILKDQHGELWNLSVENAYDQAYEKGLMIELSKIKEK